MQQDKEILDLLDVGLLDVDLLDYDEQFQAVCKKRPILLITRSLARYTRDIQCLVENDIQSLELPAHLHVCEVLHIDQPMWYV